jgi:hypothetical protein
MTHPRAAAREGRWIRACRLLCRLVERMGGVYFMNEAAFELPAVDVVDSSVTSLETRAPSGELIGIRVHRMPLPPDRTLREIVAEHVAEATRTLPAYSVEWQRDVEVSGAPAIEVAARWRARGGMRCSRHVHLGVQGLWLIVSVNGALGDLSTVDVFTDRILGTFRFAR